MQTDDMEYVTVQDAAVPAIGLGTWQLTGDACYESVLTGLELGYRHVDTAQAYGNERQVGQAIADSDVDREDVFLTTKVMPGNARYDDLVRSAEQSLDRLRTDYVDLLLLHWPNYLVDFADTARAFETLVQRDAVRHVGVSNFSRRRLAKAREKSPVPLLGDQVQMHPFRPRRKLLRYCQDEELLLTAYSPLGHGGLLDDDVLVEIGDAYDKSPAQVAIRWAIQHHNVAAIPKATSREHLEQNLDVFDFRLTEDEIERIARPSLVRTGAAMIKSRVAIPFL